MNLLEQYLTFASRFTLELYKQTQSVNRLQKVAELVVRLKWDHGYNDIDAMKEYIKEIEKLNKEFFGPMKKF